MCVRQKETYWGTYPGSKTAYAFTILLKAYGHAMRTEVGQASGSMWGSSNPERHCVHASLRLSLLPPCSRKQAERSASQVRLRL